jgi:F0F1-type ATP synthase membrane subunit b/b'
MDKLLQDLGGIVLNGLPTFFLVIVLALCVKFLYLKPLEKVLAERYRLTEGARKSAEESFKSADSKIAQYEESLAKARGEIYREQSEYLKQLQDQQAAQVKTVRAEAEQRIAAAKVSIAEEARTAAEGLEAQSDTLAAQIADAVLARRVA